MSFDSSSRSSGFPPLPPTSHGDKTLQPERPSGPPEKSPEQQVADCIGVTLSSDPRQGSSAPAEATPAATRPYAVGPGSCQGSSLPESVGGYQILGVLGHGGMGIVYEARHFQLGRTVALKMILSGDDAPEGDLFRFRREAATIARLQHPNIVQVYEVGEHEGKPFFSMEYCPGGRLDRVLAGKPLGPWQAAALVEQLARAVHVLHAKGILHRDLKPSNVLFGEDGTPKISDFGLAKKLGEQGKTVTGEVLGTPSYMAPEQAAGKNRDVGPASDTYALGAILYHCLTGRPPFKAATVAYTLYQVMTEGPTPPGRINPDVPEALEAICLRCLEKDPQHRYDSALSLAQDLNGFLAYRPAEPPPAAARGRLARWLWDNKGAAASLALAVLTLLVGIAFASREAGRPHELGQARIDETAQNPLRPNEKGPAVPAVQADDPPPETVPQNRQEAPAVEVERLRPDPVTTEAASLKTHEPVTDPKGATEAMETNVAKEPPVAEPTRKHKEPVVEKTSNDRPRREQPAHPWAGHERRASFVGHAGGVVCLAVRADGMRIVSGGSDKAIKVWDAQSGNELLSIKDTDEVTSVCFSPDGNHILSGSTGLPVKVWDAQTGQQVGLLSGHRGVINSVCYSPDGRRIASASADQFVKVWDAQTGRELCSLGGHTRQVTSVTFSPDGKRLLSGSADGTARVWDLVACKEVLSLKGHSSWITDVSFSPDGKRILTASSDATLKVWDADKGEVIHTLEGHTQKVSGGRFSPDGAYVLSGSHDATLAVWDAATGKRLVTLRGHESEVNAVRFSPDGKRILSASWDNTLGIWAAPTEQ
jgi:WD40 repeat protein